MKKRSSFESNPLPYLEPELELRATGRWSKGGLLEVFYRGDHLGELELSQAKWSVLALLMSAAFRSRTEGWGRAFRTKLELYRLLRRRTPLFLDDPERVPRFIYELRQKLDELQPPSTGTGSKSQDGGWGKRIIEHKNTLGYRLSVPPENLHLTILDESDDSFHTGQGPLEGE